MKRFVAVIVAGNLLAACGGATSDTALPSESSVIPTTTVDTTTTEQVVAPDRRHGSRTHQIWPEVWSQHGPGVQSWEYKVNCNEGSGSGMECFLSDLTSVVVTTPAGERIELEKDFNINNFSGEVTRRWVRYGPKDGSLPEPGEYTFSYWRGSHLVYEQSVPYDAGVISYPTGVGWKRSGQGIVVWWIPPPEAASGMHYKVLVWPVVNPPDVPISQVFDWNATSGLLQNVPLLEGTSYRLNVMIGFSDGYSYSEDVFFDWPPLVNTSTTVDTTTTLVPDTTFRPLLEERYEVSVEEAVVYGTGATLDGGQVDLLLDLAVPDTETDGPRPLLVHIHGGGFTEGSRWPQWDWAARGWVAASIDYRLAGDDPLPGPRVQGFFDAVGGKSAPAVHRSVVAAVEDTLVALDYLLGRADELHIDTDRIVLKGESAGAFIALSVAYCADKFENSGPRIAAVIDFAGGISEIFCGGGTAIDPDEAAVFIAHGTADATVSFTDRALSIVDGATAAGITYELHPLEGVGHDWLLGMLGQTNADGRKIDDLMYEFLDRVLYGEYVSTTTTVAPNYGSQRAFAVASPWDDLVWRVEDADCTPVDEAADYRMAREDQVPVIPRWEHLVPANPSWNLDDDQLAAVPDLTRSEADQADAEFASIRAGASTVSRPLSEEEILRFYAASVMSWAEFDAIEQPLRKVANRISDQATTAVRGGWDVEGGNGVDGIAACALSHLTGLTATGATLCDPDVYATQAAIDPGAFYRSGYWSGLATAYLQVRQLATPEQSAVIEPFLETAAACALRFAELELESANRSGLLWNGFYVGAVASIAAAAASGDLDTFGTGVSLLDQALTEHVSEDGSTPNEIATKNEAAFMYENMIAQAAVTAALLAGHNGIGLLDHPGLGRLTDRLIREYEHPGWFAEQTGYQQTRQPNISDQAWLVHLDHVRDDPRIRPIVQALGGPWTFRHNDGGWAMSWWVVSSTMPPLLVGD